MFGFGWTEIVVLMLIGLFVFGPERLPSVISEAAGMLRHLRRTAREMTDDLKTELGPEFSDLDLRSLHPRVFVERHLLGDDDDDDVARTEPTLTNGFGAGPGGGVELAYGEIPPWDPDAT